MIEISEKDWKLFRAKLPYWQENYIDKLNQEYINILSSDENPSQKFWSLEKCIKADSQKTGVICQMTRSKLIENITSLVCNKVIAFEDLSEFSDEIKATVKLMLELNQGEDSLSNMSKDEFMGRFQAAIDNRTVKTT